MRHQVLDSLLMAKNDSDINIRDYDKGDHNKIIQLVSNIIINEFKFKLELDNLDSDLVHIEEHYNKCSGGCFWVAEISNGDTNIGNIKINKNDADNDKIIVGTTAVRRLEKFESAAELKRMYVLKRYRGFGIGQQMLDKAIDFAKSFGYSRVLLDSSHNLIAARRLYLRNGFIDVSRYNDNYRADVFMEKRL
jgi:GNAT superfamily N-acetyltransferase